MNCHVGRRSNKLDNQVCKRTQNNKFVACTVLWARSARNGVVALANLSFCIEKQTDP